jgi:hypothetical protein
MYSLKGYAADAQLRIPSRHYGRNLVAGHLDRAAIVQAVGDVVHLLNSRQVHREPHCGLLISHTVDPTISLSWPVVPNETGRQCVGRASGHAEVPAPKAFRDRAPKVQWPWPGAVVSSVVLRFQS